LHDNINIDLEILTTSVVGRHIYVFVFCWRIYL